MATLDRSGDVFVLNLGDGENRFNPDSGDAIAGFLSEVEEAQGPKALVTTATGKFFSNGLDLDWAGSDLERVLQTVDALVPLLRRVTVMAAPTVAAIQGHAFAGGAMFALAHDVRVMRADRGYVCLPEIDLHMSFTPGMNALLAAKLTPAAARDAMIFGQRWGGTAAVAAGVIDEAVAEDELLDRAVAIAAGLAGKADTSMGVIKRRLYHGASTLLLSRAEEAEQASLDH